MKALALVAAEDLQAAMAPFAISKKNPSGAWDWYTAHRALPLTKPERVLGGFMEHTHAYKAPLEAIDLAKLMDDPFAAVVVGNEWHEANGPKFRELIAKMPRGTKVWSVLFHA